MIGRIGDILDSLKFLKDWVLMIRGFFLKINCMIWLYINIFSIYLEI